MNETIINATPASRREGTVMGKKRNRKHLAVAAVALAGLAGGAAAVQAATFGDRYVANGTDTPAVFPSIAPTCAADCTIDLFAGPGTVTVKDVTKAGGTQDVPFLGFGVNSPTVSLAGGPTSVIKVPQDTVLTINLSQDGSIGDPIQLSFPSLPAADVTHSGSTYTVKASKVGTSVFQPGGNADAPKQIAQGLVGVLIVTPTGCDSCAYDASQPYDDEAVVATTDLDLEFAQHPADFSMGYFGQSPDPDGSQRTVYHLINGKSFPDTDVIDVHAGDTLLLRSVNAGVTDKSMGLLGARQVLLGRNASAYTDKQTTVAPLIGPGETADISVAIDAATPANTRYSLMDQGRQMNHGTAEGFGGALTFINVWPPAGLSVDQTTFDIATQELTATAHPGDATRIITGYQTLVTSGPAPSASDWAAAVTQPLTGSAGAAVTFTTASLPTATGGMTVWVRVQQDGPGTQWSSPVGTPVGVTAVTVDSASMSGSTLTATASALPPGAVVDGLYYSRDVTFPAGGTRFFTGATTPVTQSTTVSGTLVDGDSVFVRATSPQSSGYSSVVTATVAGPKITTTSFAAPDQLTIDATSSDSSIAAAEYSVGATAAAPGAGTAVGGVFGNSTYTFTSTLVPAPADGSVVWARVQDSNGIWSQAKSVAVVYPKPVVDVTTAFASPDQLTIDAHAVIGNVAAAEISIGATAAAAGSGTSVGSTFGNPTYSETVTVAPQPTAGDTIWVRVQDSYGTWSNAISVTV